MASAAAMEASTAVKASTPVASAEARLTARRKTPGLPSMIEAAECARMCANGSTRATETSRPSKTSAVKSTSVIEVVTIDKDSAVGHVAAMVEHNPVVVPIVSPMSPSPAEAPKKSEAEAETKCNSWTADVQPRI